MFSEGWTTDTVAAYMGPPALAVRIICSSEEPITTKTKNPSMTGPTEKPYLDFSLALMSTRPRLWMFLWNLAEEAAKTRLEAACARGGNRGRRRAGQLYERNERESMRAGERERGGHVGLGGTAAAMAKHPVPNNSRALPRIVGSGLAACGDGDAGVVRRAIGRARSRVRTMIDVKVG